MENTVILGFNTKFDVQFIVKERHTKRVLSILNDNKIKFNDSFCRSILDNCRMFTMYRMDYYKACCIKRIFKQELICTYDT